MAARTIYRDASGRELTTDDLWKSWERPRASSPVPPQALELHEQGRKAGAQGDFQEALTLLARAAELVADWAYPTYDMAFTYLLMEDVAKAEEFYAVVDRMEPRGFFTCKTFLDSLRRERAGALPQNFCKAFFLLESVPMHRPQKRETLQSIAEKFPHFPPAWKELAALLDDPDEQLSAIERGLDLDPDRETHGMLILNKAIILSRRTEQDQAVSLLAALALDRQATLSTEMLAKLTLRQILRIPDPQ
jgi:tetratricopeptide (TPR) repeat protein